MTTPKTKINSPKRDFLTLFETALFICCIVVLAFRTTHTESPTPQPAQIPAAVNDAVYSIAMSGILLFSLLLLLLGRLFTGRFSYKTTSLEIGLVIFLAATIFASYFAPDKRAAITTSLMILAPLCMAVLLVQLLNSQARIKILLISITALGIIASWQSAEQAFISNNLMLEQYRNDPDSILEPLGITRGTLNQMLLEHRLSSRGAPASFTTANSAGSFMILAAFAAIALFIERVRGRKSVSQPPNNYLFAALAVAVVLFGLVLTRSKGAIAAFVIALAVFAILLAVKRRKFSKNIILACGVLAVVVLIPLVALFGLKSGRLPGGNSMLVRWQYWKASAQMAADRPLTGVGPGNFEAIYHLYKSPSAPETVSDPHCFILSILTQYGPAGLLGFLLFLLVPLWRSTLSVSDGLVIENTSDAPFKKMSAFCIAAVVVAMLILRPFIEPPSTAEHLDEKLYVIFGSLMAPATLFFIGFIILMKSLQTERSREYALQNTSVTAVALFAGLLGVIIHNLIDFAIFEPGVLMTFCACLACLIALDSRVKLPAPSVERSTLNFRRSTFIPAAVAVAAIGFGYFNYALLPVIKSTTKITEAGYPASIGRFPLAHNLFEAATDDDPLGFEAPLKDGRLYLKHIYSPLMPRDEMLARAEQSLFIAAQRNSADCRPFDALANLYLLRAQLAPDEKAQWLAQAFDVASIAVSLYPGQAELHFQLATIADALGKTELALKHYQSAVDIEDGFREQFRVMFPGRSVISRLPENNYEQAKERLKTILEKPSQ
ncbi:MAG: O-antigen ligase family protein [Sedimentisphaerales bacterium]